MLDGEEIKTDVTMKISPIEPSNVSWNWLSIDNDTKSQFYHKVHWTIDPVKGEYNFKVIVEYNNRTFESKKLP